jgi:hypothetical protein
MGTFWQRWTTAASNLLVQRAGGLNVEHEWQQVFSFAYFGEGEHSDRSIVNAPIGDRDVGVGTPVAPRPLRRSQRADFPHWALASGPNAEALQGIGME